MVIERSRFALVPDRCVAFLVSFLKASSRMVRVDASQFAAMGDLFKQRSVMMAIW
jgi:hypothetical protein